MKRLYKCASIMLLPSSWLSSRPSSQAIETFSLQASHNIARSTNLLVLSRFLVFFFKRVRPEATVHLGKLDQFYQLYLEKCLLFWNIRDNWP